MSLIVDLTQATARVEVRGRDCLGPYVVTVQPAPGGDGWLVSDPTDCEPTWQSGHAEALGEAIAQASHILEDRIVRLVSRSELGGTAVRELADIC